MKKLLVWFADNLPILCVVAFSLLILAISLKVTLFRYSTYEYGKFDLGNMSQMVYNTAHGHFMEVTDYFGTNMPRWGMSHVDPFLVFFVPIYLFFPDPRVLIVGQLILVISCALILYALGLQITKSKVSSALVATAYLFYPANGFLLAWTGFHGITAVMPFFLLSFLVYELFENKTLTLKKFIFLFSVMTFITLTGKEEVSLIYLMYGIYIMLFRKYKKVGLVLSIVGILWFAVSFLWLIPSASSFRINGFETFAKSVDLNASPSRDVLSENYFLARYADFGSSYQQVLLNMATHPVEVIQVFFSGQHKDNFMMTFLPVLFIPFFYLPVLMIASPEFAINYLTTQGGIGTSEIYNHRISIIIPILFISIFFSLKLFQTFFNKFFNKNPRFLAPIISSAVLISCLITSNSYGNPVLLWFTQSLTKRIPILRTAFAKTAVVPKKPLVPGDQASINRLETKDVSCFNNAVALVGKGASVSSPDYLGDHLSARRYNSLFPANFDSSDYVLVDVFSKKVETILGVSQGLVNTVVGKVLKNQNYDLIYSCSNLFVFKRVGPHNSSELLPIQDSFDYAAKFAYLIGRGLNIVDLNLPPDVERGHEFDVIDTYKRNNTESLDAFILYTSFENTDTGKLLQVAHLPSFGLDPVSTWQEERYYTEDNKFVIPESYPSGNYRVYVGMTNGIKTYNVYIGSIHVK